MKYQPGHEICSSGYWSRLVGSVWLPGDDTMQATFSMPACRIPVPVES